jgi:myosin-1
MTKGTTGELRDKLGMADPQYYNYLSCSNEYNADGVNDVEEFEAMSNAMDVCKIKPEDKQAIFDITAAILHLGNITFVEGENATQAVLADPNSLAYPAYLLNVSEEMLSTKLLGRIMRTGGSKRGSTYLVNLNCEQAAGSRDALAKVYLALTT